MCLLRGQHRKLRLAEKCLQRVIARGAGIGTSVKLAGQSCLLQFFNIGIDWWSFGGHRQSIYTIWWSIVYLKNEKQILASNQQDNFFFLIKFGILWAQSMRSRFVVLNMQIKIFGGQPFDRKTQKTVSLAVIRSSPMRCSIMIGPQIQQKFTGVGGRVR